MTVPFVRQLRTNGAVIRLAGGDGQLLHLRVQAADAWDSVPLDAPATATVADVKRAALDVIYPHGAPAEDLIVRLHGFEILDERATLASVGVQDGSILLIINRRRRPVR